jgi:hypothetical protein
MGEIARLVHTTSPHLRRHGRHPFTFLTPLGRLRVHRHRLLDPKTGKSFIPSAVHWKTRQNRHLVSALAVSACECSQELSYRKSAERLCSLADSEPILCASTVWNLKQKEGEQLAAAQQQFIDQGLKAYGTILAAHGFLPPPTNDSRDSQESFVETHSESPTESPFEATIHEEATAMYHYFTSEFPLPKEQEDLARIFHVFIETN